MMGISSTILFLPIIYVWAVHDGGAYFGQTDPASFRNFHLFVSPDQPNIQQNTFGTSDFVAFPSSPGSTDHAIKAVHSYDTAATPLLADYGQFTKAFYQTFKWPPLYYKKPTKYFKHHSLTGLKLKHASKANTNSNHNNDDDDSNAYYHQKNCCQDGGWPLSLLTNKKLMQRPLGPWYYPGNQDYGYRPVDDVKPVVEHIEGDLKYDFRTGKHSF